MVPFISSRKREDMNNRLLQKVINRITFLGDEIREIKASSSTSERLSSTENERCQMAEEELRSQQTREKIFTVRELSKCDRRRCALQILFLRLLSEVVPEKYKTCEQFQQHHPGFRHYDNVEKEKLRVCANWFDLALLTTKPEMSKTYLMRMVPWLAEGCEAKYITGTGESQGTRDRVSLYRAEGKQVICKRAKRNRTKFKRNGDKAASPSFDGHSNNVPDKLEPTTFTPLEAASRKSCKAMRITTTVRSSSSSSSSSTLSSATKTHDKKEGTRKKKHSKKGTSADASSVTLGKYSLPSSHSASPLSFSQNIAQPSVYSNFRRQQPHGNVITIAKNCFTAMQGLASTNRETKSKLPYKLANEPQDFELRTTLITSCDNTSIDLQGKSPLLTDLAEIALKFDSSREIAHLDNNAHILK
jgi:hypothetical protein